MSSHRRPSRPSTAIVAAVLVLGVAAPAAAAQYWTVPAVLKSFFQSSKRVAPRKITLSEGEAAAIAKKVGVSSVKTDWSIYVGQGDEGRLDGFAVVAAEKGMHEPIDFAVHFAPDGKVARVEIVEYREAYGDEVRRERFRNQFRGKTADDPITVGKDIDIVSGASISSRSVAVGVKRDALIVQAAMKRGVLP